MTSALPEYPTKPGAAAPIVVGTVYPAGMQAVHDMQPLVVGPVPTQFQPQPMTNWSSGICDFSNDVKSCVEVSFCHYCQASRQYNVLTYGQRGIEPWSCLMPFMLDAFVGCSVGSFFMAWHLRQRIRHRYMIAGDDFSDCLNTFFCSPCVLCQNYREMSLRGEWPSGCCIDEPYQLYRPPHVHEMGEAGSPATGEAAEW